MPEDSGGSPSIGQVGGIIPHFYFDLIGRIVPGGLFLIGLGVLYFPSQLRKFWLIFVPPIEKDSGTYLIFAASLLLFALSLVGYIVGSFLGTLSYHVFESKLFQLIAVFPLLDTATVFPKSFPSKVALEKRFKHHFGENLTDQTSRSLTEFSRLCSYFVWARNVNLGQMTARWDAEALAGRNVLFGAAVLLVLRLIQIGINLHDIFHDTFEISMAVIAVAALLHYRFQRRIQISGRYSLFWAVSQDKKKNELAANSAQPTDIAQSPSQEA